ncbi:MAG: response regulator [Gammaproteobacteria bacterium]|nr:response regulator [Gammaproteobacteria bacterium]
MVNNKSQKSILIAEDERMLRNMLEMGFSDENYRINFAENGIAALRLLNADQYDLLLTDLFMPQMNGIELIHKCRALSPSTKIVLMSGGGQSLYANHGEKHVQFQHHKLEVDMFLGKPFDLDEILSTVKNILFG